MRPPGYRSGRVVSLTFGHSCNKLHVHCEPVTTIPFRGEQGWQSCPVVGWDETMGARSGPGSSCRRGQTQPERQAQPGSQAPCVRSGSFRAAGWVWLGPWCWMAHPQSPPATDPRTDAVAPPGFRCTKPASGRGRGRARGRQRKPAPGRAPSSRFGSPARQTRAAAS